MYSCLGTSKKLSFGVLIEMNHACFSIKFSVFDRPKTRCVKCVPKCASARVAPSNIVYYCTDIDPQGKVN